MILYQLQCSRGHGFEGWFRDSSAYDRQANKGDISCPMCGSADVVKAPMAPSVVSRGAEKELSPERRARELAREILIATGKLQKHVEEHFEYVGDKFADEARAIHNGDAEERDIYGEATIEEAKALHEDEIPVRYLGPKRPKPS
jgi:hypothetical protein